MRWTVLAAVLVCMLTACDSEGGRVQRPQVTLSATPASTTPTPPLSASATSTPDLSSVLLVTCDRIREAPSSHSAITGQGLASAAEAGVSPGRFLAALRDGCEGLTEAIGSPAGWDARVPEQFLLTHSVDGVLYFVNLADLAVNLKCVFVERNGDGFVLNRSERAVAVEVEPFSGGSTPLVAGASFTSHVEECSSLVGVQSNSWTPAANPLAAPDGLILLWSQYINARFGQPASELYSPRCRDEWDRYGDISSGLEFVLDRTSPSFRIEIISTNVQFLDSDHARVDVTGETLAVPDDAGEELLAMEVRWNGLSDVGTKAAHSMFVLRKGGTWLIDGGDGWCAPPSWANEADSGQIKGTPPDIQALVDGWTASLAAQDVKRFLDHYSDELYCRSLWSAVLPRALAGLAFDRLSSDTTVTKSNGSSVTIQVDVSATMESEPESPESRWLVGLLTSPFEMQLVKSRGGQWLIQNDAYCERVGG